MRLVRSLALAACLTPTAALALDPPRLLPQRLGAISAPSAAITGDVSAGSVTTPGTVSGGSVTTPGTVSGAAVSASGAVSGATLGVTGAANVGSLTTPGAIGAGSAAITGGLSAGSVTAPGAVSGGSVSAAGAVSGASLGVTGAASVGSLTSSGAISAPSAAITGGVTAGSVQADVSPASATALGVTRPVPSWLQYTAQMYAGAPSDSAGHLSISDRMAVVNGWVAQGNVANGGPVLAAVGADTNIDANIAAKHLGGVYFGNGSGILGAFLDNGKGTASSSYLALKPGDGSALPTLASTTSAQYDVPTGSEHVFSTGGVIQAKIRNIAANTTVTGWPVLSSGGDKSALARLEFEAPGGVGTTLNSYIRTSGAGSIFLANYGGSILIADSNSQFNAVNALNLRAGTTGVPVVMRAFGETNAGLLLQPAGTGTVQAERFEMRSARIDTGLLRLVPASGFSQTIASTGAGSGGLKLNPAATLASGTITLPASPVDGQVVRVTSTQQITALTVSPGSGQTIASGAAPTSMAPNAPFALIYDTAGSIWTRY